MRIALLAGAVAASTLTAGCTTYGGRPGDEARTYRNYDYNRPDPRYNGYYADRYYREGPQYRERRLSRNERIYRGQDGRYYCRRRDGTTGLVVGALAGGALGNAIAPGDSQTLGTIIGAIAGAVIGREVDRGNARCR
jgi:Glycine zipper 2TM domain